MPEGPEVESVRQELLPLIKNRVKQIQLTPLSQKYPKYQNKQPTFEPFRETILKEIYRYGKFLVWCFDGTEMVILNHLGMSGKWCFYEDMTTSQSDVTHPKVIIQMESPPHLIFNDTRNFGQFRVFGTYDEVMKYPPIKSLGIDGLEIPFPLDEFISRIRTKRYDEKIIGELLLNQRLVAGVGNIYKSEALFQAKINPLRKVKTLSKKDLKQLGLAISEVMQKALKDLGSSIDSLYTLPSGESGNAQLWHNVYGRKGKQCNICESEIKKITQKERSTFFCSKCQQ